MPGWSFFSFFLTFYKPVRHEEEEEDNELEEACSITRCPRQSLEEQSKIKSEG